MANFLQQVVSGLATGGIFASLALALVLIYRATRVINFAQGEMGMFAAFIAPRLIDSGWPYWSAFAMRSRSPSSEASWSTSGRPPGRKRPSSRS